MNSPFCQWILVLVHWHLHYIYKLTERPVVLLNAIFTYRFAVDPTFSSCLFMPQGSYSIIRKFTTWTLSLKRTDYLIPFGWSHDYACSIGVLITTIRFVRPLNSNQKCTTCNLGFGPFGNISRAIEMLNWKKKISNTCIPNLCSDPDMGIHMVTLLKHHSWILLFSNINISEYLVTSSE